MRFGKLIALGLWLAGGAAAAHADDWPQWLGPQRDGVWREQGIVAKFPAGGPKKRWAVKIGAGYAGPAVAGGKVYVTDRILAAGQTLPESGFVKTKGSAGKERVLCLDDATGKILWTHEYDCRYSIQYASGPRTTPIVAGGKVWTLGAMGDLVCLDAETGKLIWAKNLLKECQFNIPIWGLAASPLLEGDRLICLAGGKGSTVVAFEKDTGKELWRALSADPPGYVPPMIYDIAGKRRLIIWAPNAVSSLDPLTGKVFWSVPYGKVRQIKVGLSVAAPRLDGDLLFLTAFYEGALMLKLHGDAKPEVFWQRRGRSEMPEDDPFAGLHSIMPTPFLRGGHIYGICSYGELRCLDEKTGKRIWETFQPTTGRSERWGNAFLVEQGDRFFLFNEKGDLIIAKLTPQGYTEIDRAHLLDPTNTMAPPKGRRVLWSHPAFANRNVYVRNDREIASFALAKE